MSDCFYIARACLSGNWEKNAQTNKQKTIQEKGAGDSQKHKKWEIMVDKGEFESSSVPTEKFIPELQLGV